MTPGDARHLVLIGLMGAGKTSVGERCAQRLGRDFVDTDELIVSLAGRSVADIFASGGEREFRELERQVIEDVCASPSPLVISSGGGAVLDAQSRRRLHGAGCVVWLRADAATLAARVGAQARERPLLPTYGAEAELRRLAEVRAPAYESTAHRTVDTDGRSIDEVADAVLQELARCPS